MAANNQHRITKDISARKNQVDSDSAYELAMELKAEQRGHEAYVKTMKADYREMLESQDFAHKEMMETLKNEHDSSLAELKAQYAKSDMRISQEKQEAVDEAVKRERGGLKTVFEGMKTKNNSLTAENEKLQASLKEALATSAEAAKTHANDINKLRINHNTVSVGHTREIAELKRKLDAHPNSWVEIHFVGKARKQRTYYRKVGAKFSNAITELCGDIMIHPPDIRFTLLNSASGGRVGVDLRKTLEQNGIGEGARIEYEKV